MLVLFINIPLPHTKSYNFMHFGHFPYSKYPNDIINLAPLIRCVALPSLFHIQQSYGPI